MKTTCAAGVLVGIVVLAGCDNTPPPPPPAPAAAPAPANPIDKLAENPQSLLGKSAARARDVARQAEASQAQAVGMANEVSGQAAAFTVAGLEFRAPTTWEKVEPSNRMQAAVFRIPAPEGVDTGGPEARVVFFTFGPGQGGDAASNINRWKQMVVDSGGQPVEPKVVARTAAGQKVTTVEMEGTFKDGLPGGPTTDRPGFAFRGAIIDNPQAGNVFIRFTGPAEVVKAAEGDFNTMVLGFRKE